MEPRRPRETLTRAARAVALALLLSVSAGAERAAASLITLVHEGSGSGTLDGTAFSGAFTVTATGDIGDVEALDPIFGPGVALEHDAAQIEIAGLGTFDLVTATLTVVNNDLRIVTFGAFNDPFLPGQPLPQDVLSGPTSALFDSYGLSSSIGPVSGSGNVQGVAEAIETSGGDLFFSGAATDAQFTAVVNHAVIPLPAALPLLAAGLAALGLVGRRRV